MRYIRYTRIIIKYNIQPTYRIFTRIRFEFRRRDAYDRYEYNTYTYIRYRGRSKLKERGIAPKRGGVVGGRWPVAGGIWRRG